MGKNSRFVFDDDVQPGIGGSLLTGPDDHRSAGKFQDGRTLNSIASLYRRSLVDIGSKKFLLFTEVHNPFVDLG